jgi:hypothetical protein
MRKLIFLCISVLAACSVHTVRDPNSEVIDFLDQFQSSIVTSDTLALKFFQTNQTPEAILAAIRLLRNPDKGYIECIANFNQPQILWEDNGPTVTIPIAITTKDNPVNRKSITLWLKKKNESFIISKLDAEDFYKDYFQAFNMIKYEKDRAEQLIKLQIHFDRSRSLQNEYDSVVWFTQLSGKAYYYVVNGEWKNSLKSIPLSYKMGLVDESGAIIVPPEFDLIGTPGIVFPGLIEVTQSNKIGYYTLTGSEIISPKYDLVIPYLKDQTKAIVKIDTTYGWLDSYYIYHDGFQSKQMQDYINNFFFLDEKIELSFDSQPLCQIPNPELIGDGIIIPPVYLVRYGLFNPIMSGFVTGYEGFYSSTEYVKKESFNTYQLSDKIMVLISKFKSRFLEGREEFYYSSKLTLVNGKRDTLSTTRIPYGQLISLSRKDSALLEIKISYENYWEPDEFGALDYPGFKYYKIGNNQLISLESNRVYDMTEYVKLDSSYFQGLFRMYNFSTDEEYKVTFMPNEFFNELRNDILSSYGYIFTDQKVNDRLQYAKWYSPSITEYKGVYEIASEIDKHNLDFIERIIGPVVIESM